MQMQLAGGEGGEDPVVKLKEQELQIRAANDEMDNQVDQARLQIESQKAAETARANERGWSHRKTLHSFVRTVARERLNQVQGAQNAPKAR
jgi:hypothetical protein